MPKPRYELPSQAGYMNPNFWQKFNLCEQNPNIDHTVKIVVTVVIVLDRRA